MSIEKLEIPKSWINPIIKKQPQRIVFEGLIGAGKTSAATLLSKHINFSLAEEPIRTNLFLEKFYENPSRWAFPMQCHMLISRLAMERAGTYNVLSGFIPGIIFDRSLAGDTCFAEINTSLGNMSPEEYHLYLRLYETMKIECPYPDVIIFLDVSLDTIKQRIKDRNRYYEQSLLEPTNSYLQQLSEAYDRFCTAISQHTLVLKIDWHIFLPIDILWDKILGAWNEYSESRFHKLLLKW